MLLLPAGALCEGGKVFAPAANLHPALKPKDRAPHYVAAVWLSLCSCQACHVPASPCQRGCTSVQHLVVAGAVGWRRGLQEEPDFVVLAGCNGHCHCCICTAYGGSKACCCVVDTLLPAYPISGKGPSQPKKQYWFLCAHATDLAQLWCVF